MCMLDFVGLRLLKCVLEIDLFIKYQKFRMTKYL